MSPGEAAYTKWAAIINPEGTVARLRLSTWTKLPLRVKRTWEAVAEAAIEAARGENNASKRLGGR
jgi:hypothetical protein